MSKASVPKHKQVSDFARIVAEQVAGRQLEEKQWRVQVSDEYEAWYEGLTSGEQLSLRARVQVLQSVGPSVRRPLVGALKRSKHPNMRELIVQHAGRPYRILFAFDPLSLRFC